MITIMNQMAEKWFSWQLSMLWQVGVLIVIVAGLDTDEFYSRNSIYG
jgi:hypothetical protein